MTVLIAQAPPAGWVVNRREHYSIWPDGSLDGGIWLAGQINGNDPPECAGGGIVAPLGGGSCFVKNIDGTWLPNHSVQVYGYGLDSNACFGPIVRLTNSPKQFYLLTGQHEATAWVKGSDSDTNFDYAPYQETINTRYERDTTFPWYAGYNLYGNDYEASNIIFGFGIFGNVLKWSEFNDGSLGSWDAGQVPLHDGFWEQYGGESPGFTSTWTDTDYPTGAPGFYISRNASTPMIKEIMITDYTPITTPIMGQAFL